MIKSKYLFNQVYDKIYNLIIYKLLKIKLKIIKNTYFNCNSSIKFKFKLYFY